LNRDILNITYYTSITHHIIHQIRIHYNFVIVYVLTVNQLIYAIYAENLQNAIYNLCEFSNIYKEIIYKLKNETILFVLIFDLFYYIESSFKIICW